MTTRSPPLVDDVGADQSSSAAQSITTPPLSGMSSKLRSTAPEYYPRNSPLTSSTAVRPTPLVPSEVTFDFILVIDFEATCDEPQPPNYIPEIIEFPVVVIDVAQQRCVAEYHRFVRPIDKPILTPFCRQLTGISQEDVTAASDLQSVVNEFDAWLASVVPVGKSFMFATDGPWDMRDFMHAFAVRYYDVKFPDYFFRWIDVKETFAEFFGCRRGKIAAMLEHFGLAFEGRQHSGIDDARNIARIVLSLLSSGCSLSTIDEIEKAPPRAHLRRQRTRNPRVFDSPPPTTPYGIASRALGAAGFALPPALPGQPSQMGRQQVSQDDGRR